MNRGPTARATIELTLGCQAPEGVVTDSEGRARAFSGWIGLAAAIEDWRRPGDAQDDPDDARGVKKEHS